MTRSFHRNRETVSMPGSRPYRATADRRSAGGGRSVSTDPRRDVAVVLGTRPEIIKLAPVISALGARARLIWTGQHYDPCLADVFFHAANLGLPEERLAGVGGFSRAAQMLAVMSGLSERFEANRPAVVVVQGDTNTTNAAAQAAHYHGIPVVHVEAGLRSFDRGMPEEINRLIVGAVADVHCCATAGNAEYLRRAGVPEAAIRVTGNTIVEATLAALPDSAGCREVLARHHAEPDGYVLATVHRPENTDDPARLALIVDALARLPWPVVFPIHPRTHAAIARFGFQERCRPLRVVDPLDHPTFLGLAAHARLVVSDSGGVQEEVTVLKKPLVVVRNSTERPESVAAGFAWVARPDQLTTAMVRMLDPDLAVRLRTVPSPFGDGRAAARIASEVLALAHRDNRSPVSLTPDADPQGPSEQAAPDRHAGDRVSVVQDTSTSTGLRLVSNQ